MKVAFSPMVSGRKIFALFGVCDIQKVTDATEQHTVQRLFWKMTEFGISGSPIGVYVALSGARLSGSSSSLYGKDSHVYNV